MSDQDKFELLATFTQLEKEARTAVNIKELMFIIANRTRRLVQYTQSIVWSYEGLNDQVNIRAISAVSVINYDAPYIVWISKVIQHLQVKFETDRKVQIITRDGLPDNLAKDWANWLPSEVLVCPIYTISGLYLGGILLNREQPWQDYEKNILVQLIHAYGHAWYSLKYAREVNQQVAPQKRKFILKIVALCVLIFFLIPVHQTVLAPSEIVARDPSVISPAMDGVVDKIYVEPNQSVSKGQVLFSLDATEINNENNIAEKALAVSLEKYRKVGQHAFVNNEAKGDIALLKLEMEKSQAKLEYTKHLLSRIQVRAPHDGVVIFSDKSDWIGKPVKTGEKVMLVANPNKKELSIWLPVTDAIALDRGAPIKLFLNVAPLRSISAILVFASYSAVERPDNVLAYHLKAKFIDEETVPRIGLKGTSKIYGDKVFMFYYLFWRPIAYVRQKIGF